MNINEKKLKILRVLYSILCVTIGICVIVFSAIIYTNIKKNNAIFDGLLENWENDPIINLHIKSNPDEECSNRNDSLFFYFWPGTIAGCDCTIFGPLNSRCCDAADILLNKTEHCCIGKEIKEQSPRKVHEWRFHNQSGISNPSTVKICASRIKNYNFKQKNTSQCLETEKLCGENQTNFAYCVPKESKCPILMIKFAVSNPDSKIYDQSIQIPNSSLSIFYSTIAKDALPISEFRVSAGNGVCAENRKPNSKSGEKYILEIREHCDFVDNRFKETGLSLDEQNFMEANKLDKIVMGLSGYKYSKKDEYKLYYRNYVYLKTDCRSSIKEYYEINNNIDNIQNLSLALMIFCIIFGLCLLKP